MLLILPLLAALTSCRAENWVEDYSKYVDPLLGVEGSGNMFPGAVRPVGMVKLGVDLDGASDAYSGYLADGVVWGFSMTHNSGTGGAPKYGVVSQMPWVGNLTNPLSNLTSNRTEPDQAEVGYYRVSLDSGVIVELAASERAGMYRYTFGDEGGEASNVVVDVSHVLPSYRGFGWSQSYTMGGIEVFEDGHYELNGTYDGGWNIAPNWTIYGCGKFDHEATSALVFEGEGGNTTSPGNLISYGETTSAYGPQRVGVVYTFPPGSDVTSRVGISYISSSKACDNLHREISDISFDDLVTQTRDVWKKEVLSKITLPNGTEEDKRLLYSMMYGSFLMPTNKTDENPGWESSEPYYEDTFTFWDTHRCATAMWQVLVPRIYEEYLRAIIDTFRFEGWISDARSSFWNGKVQGGSNSDNVLADAYVKGVRGKINWEDAYASMVKNAEVVPENNFDPMANDSSTAEGRGALPDYLEYGYITPNYSRSVSRAIEYSVNDFCVSQVAYGLGKQDDGDKYLARSRNWRNHWNTEAESLGYKGFVVPRYANGSFAIQDPLTCDGCYWMDEYYQAPPWEYSWAATHDTAKLVEWTGSPEEFVNRLDVMFEPGINPDGSEQFNYTLHNPGNQPGYIVPYLYNYAGRQDLSTARARRVAKKYYGTGLDGIPGNSDAGAMQTWLLWNMIGLYPVTGRNVFLIHSPWQSCTIDLEQGRKLEISVEGGDSEEAIYVQSLKINGQDWKKNWLTWDDVLKYGARMEYVLGGEANDWFEGGELPPSLD